MKNTLSTAKREIEIHSNGSKKSDENEKTRRSGPATQKET